MYVRVNTNVQRCAELSKSGETEIFSFPGIESMMYVCLDSVRKRDVEYEPVNSRLTPGFFPSLSRIRTECISWQNALSSFLENSAHVAQGVRGAARFDIQQCLGDPLQRHLKTAIVPVPSSALR